MDFGKTLRKRKSQIKYEAFYCSEIQSEKLIGKLFRSVCFLKHEGVFFIRATFHFIGPIIIKNQC